MSGWSGFAYSGAHYPGWAKGVAHSRLTCCLRRYDQGKQEAQEKGRKGVLTMARMGCLRIQELVVGIATVYHQRGGKEARAIV